MQTSRVNQHVLPENMAKLSDAAVLAAIEYNMQVQKTNPFTSKYSKMAREENRSFFEEAGRRNLKWSDKD